MAFQSLNYTQIAISCAAMGVQARILKDYALDGNAVEQGWNSADDLYSVLEGLNDALFTENPSKIYKVSFSLIPGSEDQKFIETYINKVKSIGGMIMGITISNTWERSSYTSDECYIVNAPSRIYTKSPAGMIYTALLNKCIATSPSYV